MNKKLTPMMAALLASGLILSAPTYAAPKENPKSEAHDTEKAKPNQKEKKVNENKQKENKGQIQQLKLVDKQLDKIEEKLSHYEEKVSDMIETDTEDTKDTEVTNENTTTEDTTLTNSEPINEEVTSDESAYTSSEVTSSDTTTTEPTSTTESNDDTTSDEVTTDADTENNDSTTEEITDDEIESEVEEVEDELKEKPGYAGKFTALQNRLNAVTNHLNSLAKKGIDSTELQKRYDRIASLDTKIEEIIATMSQVQNKVTEQISNETDIQEEQAVEDAPVTKEWKIQFNKKLNANTLSNLNIIVLDSKGNLVETTFTYSAETKTITVSPLQEYVEGETYTLFIGKEISDIKGGSLKNAVKMKFTTK